MTLQDLNGSRVLVVGASSGIGRATALAFAREGADVAVAARREGRLADLSATIESEYGVTTLAVPTDVREESAVEALVGRVVETFGGLDAVAVSVGIMRGGPVETLGTGDYHAMTDTHVDGTFFLTRAVLPHLRESSGHLVYVGSFAGKYPRSPNPVYAGTKWWLQGFAHSLAGQVGGDGVAVTVVNPAEVRTEMGPGGRSMADLFGPGEALEPEEVAESVVFAARQPQAVAELGIYRRDRFEEF